MTSLVSVMGWIHSGGGSDDVADMKTHLGWRVLMSWVLVLSMLD